jgi:serine/threonine protein kinase
MMEFLQGGELFSHLRKQEKFDDVIAKFYCTEVAVALSKMHSLTIAYRDIKPENIMLGNYIDAICGMLISSRAAEEICLFVIFTPFLPPFLPPSLSASVSVSTPPPPLFHPIPFPLLDRYGHIRLVDFGFAKIVPDRTFTLCGTPEYLAPEVIQGNGYGPAVDW